MLVGRKNCRKIVQFLVEPLMKKQSISQQVSGFFCILFIQIVSGTFLTAESFDILSTYYTLR